MDIRIAALTFIFGASMTQLVQAQVAIDATKITCGEYTSPKISIPLRLENPKIGGVDDAEIVGDRIAEDRPVSWYLLAQEM